MSPKEKLEKMLSGKDKTGIINGWEGFEMMMNPVTLYVSPLRPNGVVKDGWGVTMSWPKGQPGVMPLEGEALVCPDIEEWKEVLHAPKVKGVDFDWQPFLAQQEEIRRQGKMSVALVPVGNFELMHNLFGYENCLANLLLEPEIMAEVAEYIANYRMECYVQICEHLKPDILFQHDDWGAKHNLLMSPEIFRSMFKPHYQKLYDYVHEKGVLVMHHADSYLEPLLSDLEDLKIDIWQGVLPSNPIVQMQKDRKTNLIFMGGIESAIDREDCSEEEIRSEVRRVCDTYLEGGNFIPAVTGGGPTSIFSHIDPIIFDEIEKINNKRA